MKDLHDMSADELLTELAKRQQATIAAEDEETVAKAKFEAIQGAVMDSLKRSGHPVEIAKKLMWGEAIALQALDEYREVANRLKIAEKGERRWLKAFDAWQTIRADLRGKV